MAIRVSKESFVDKAREKHGDKYDYSDVDYVRSKDKVEIICPDHGSFFMTPNNHLKGAGCRKCSLRDRKGVEKLTTSTFIAKSKNIHGDFYDYSLVNYTGVMSRVVIICPLHGRFDSIPNNHLRGAGCRLCGIHVGIKSWITTEEKFYERLHEIHGDQYSFNYDEYVNSHSPLTVVCREHGEFKSSYDNLLRGKGCVVCGTIKNLAQYYDNDRDCYLYLLKLRFPDSKVCYKVGVSWNPSRRARAIANDAGCEAEVSYAYKTDHVTAYAIEQILHRDNLRHKKIPPKTFGGYTECYSEDIALELLELIAESESSTFK